MNFDITIAYMKKDQIEPIFDFREWRDRLNADEIDDDGDNSQIKQVQQWRSITVDGKH